MAGVALSMGGMHASEAHALASPASSDPVALAPKKTMMHCPLYLGNAQLHVLTADLDGVALILVFSQPRIHIAINLQW